MKTKNLKKITIISGLILLITACQNSSTEFVPSDSKTNTPAVVDETQVDKDGKCIQVFYDKSSDPQYSTGRTYALMLLNLLGHFPEYQQVYGPVEYYQKGDLDRCYASFYIGSYYNNALPADFISDYLSTSKRVVWLGYSIWQLGLEFENIFGYSSQVSFTGIDTVNKSTDGKPSFFRDILYKGEVFSKYGKYTDSSNTTFVAAPELVRFQSKLADKATVLAQAKHSYTNEVIPWALQVGNRYYVSEIPFSYVYEGDRYLVFADLLFDFLGEAPKHDQKYALVRLEDVNPLSDQLLLDTAVEIQKKYAAAPTISLTPIYEDVSKTVRLENSPILMNQIKRYQQNGHVFLWHGIKFPSSSVASTGAVDMLNQLEDGFNSLKQAQLAPKFWVTPGYTASSMDNIIFGKTFYWNVGRASYTDYKVENMKSLKLDLSYDLADSTRQQSRIDYFSPMAVTESTSTPSFGQFFPYEIYGNQYYQKVIPENLGQVTPGQRSVADMLADAKRNLVLRDIWASGIYHTYLLSPSLNPANSDPLKPTDLENLVSGLKALGYQFVNLNDYALSNKMSTLKPRVELEASR